MLTTSAHDRPFLNPKWLGSSGVSYLPNTPRIHLGQSLALSDIRRFLEGGDKLPLHIFHRHGDAALAEGSNQTSRG